jgi:hypothetical protein
VIDVVFSPYELLVDDVLIYTMATADARKGVTVLNMYDMLLLYAWGVTSAGGCGTP